MGQREQNENIRGYLTVNRRYKDRLFRMVFQKKEDLPDLYNAINYKEYM
ncbi:MAG: hypothetical protein ACI4EG_02125 [Fusicatenibacter sp.]